MNRESGAPQMDTAVRIRPMLADDISAADAVWRGAFGAFLGLPDPMAFRPGASPVRTRYLADPAGSFVAEVDSEVVGSNFAINWGSAGFFGPLSVRPDHWNRGIAQRLLETALEAFASWGTEHVGLFTFAHSARHLTLYQKFGFWPRFLTLIMAKSVAPLRSEVAWSAYSHLSADEQRSSLEECRALTDAWQSGLDLSLEIEATARHDFGETVLLRDGNTFIGFAVCHAGPGTEAGSGNCAVKFGAVRPGANAESSFSRLLAACEALAVARGAPRLVAGVNTARREAYRALLTAGFRTEVQGLAMDRPDEAGYNRPGVAIIDYWR
jgi:GNAT superfamily N-acetyltransferase